MTLGGWIFLAIVVAVILFAVIAYNRLVGLRRRSEAAWSDIDVQLKRRTDLVPNLVETVKGYAVHDRTTLDQVIRARGAEG
jgi:LemA protein